MSCDNSDCKNIVVYEERCERCNLQIYCSPDCSREDWFSRHKFICPSMNTLKLQDFDTNSPRLLGRGGVGEAFLVKHKLSSQLFVMKRIEKSKNNINLVRLREIDVHKQLRHPNIIKLHGYIEDARYIYLVLEYAENGSLFSYIKKSDATMSEKLSWHFFTQIVLGLHYLHANNIIHRDLKPENVLVDRNLNIKICDFGACVKTEEDTRKTYIGTLQFMPPEMVNETGHSFEVDIWAIGIMLYELLHGCTPFVSNSDRGTKAMIREVQLNIHPSVSIEAKDLLQGLIRRKPSDRLKLKAVLAHPWVKKYATRCEFELGQSVVSQELGHGHIEAIEGLICRLNFNGVHVEVPVPDLIKQFEVGARIDLPTFTKSDSEYNLIEDKLLCKLEKMCRKPKRNSRNSRNSRQSRATKHSRASSIMGVNFSELGGGILEINELEYVKNDRFFRNPIGSYLTADHQSRRESSNSQKIEKSVDLSEETMNLRLKELERISSNIQNSNIEARKSAPKRSIFSYFF